MLIRQAHQKSVIVVTIGIFDEGFQFQLDVCNLCRDVLMMSMNLSDIASLNIHDADNCCIISGISKSKPINVIQNIDLTEKSRTL